MPRKANLVEIHIGQGGVTFHAAASEIQSVELRRPHALPFLKWAGGKQWLGRMAHIFQPSLFKGTYYEPFLGGGSVFFALNPGRAVLADCNRELIITYKSVASEAETVISLLKSYPYERDFYNRLRLELPSVRYKRAARLIYLNKTSWNGLYRVNLKGQFNGAFGAFTRVPICPDR